MSFDIGTIVIIAAVLIFYLRLIIIQRERARRLRQPAQAKGRGKKKSKTRKPDVYSQISILSRNPRDWLIAGLGVIGIGAGALLNQHIILGTLPQTYWWLPAALGILALSWAFR